MISEVPAGANRRLPSKPLRTAAIGITILLVLVYGDSAYGILTSSFRVAGEAQQRGPVDVIVHLPFEAQRYHIGELRRYGTYHRREDDGGIRLRSVTPENMERLSRLFWIGRIEIVE